MMNTQTTTKTNHYFRALVALAMLASLLVVLSASPHASTTFTVNLSDDRADASPGNGTCSVVNFGAFCTLRAAIQEANATPGADTINFNVNTTGDGVATISPDSPLPPITQTVTIDGYTQPGASPNTKTGGDDAVLKVQLDGTKVPDVNGLEIDTAGSSVIKGLVINRFGAGISIGGDSVANRIEGNFIGTDPTGTLNRGNADFGVVLFNGPSETVVGGDALAARNVVSGNFNEGIFVNGSSFNRILATTWAPIRAAPRVWATTRRGHILSSSDTTIGGTTAASRNVISANGDDGLLLGLSNGARVLGNRIGTTANGTGALGNDGARVRGRF